MASLKVSNSLNRQVDVYYRVKAMDGSAQPMIKVAIQSRALCNEIAFPSEAHKKAFLAQAKYLIDKEILLIGGVTEEKVVSSNEKLKEDETAEKTLKADSTIGKIEEAADNVSATMSFEAEPVANKKKSYYKKKSK